MMLYDANEAKDALLEFLDRMKERVDSGEVIGIAGWTTEMDEGDWGVRPFSMGRFDSKELVFGAEEFKHALLHGDLD